MEIFTNPKTNKNDKSHNKITKTKIKIKKYKNKIQLKIF